MPRHLSGYLAGAAALTATRRLTSDLYNAGKSYLMPRGRRPYGTASGTFRSRSYYKRRMSSRLPPKKRRTVSSRARDAGHPTGSISAKCRETHLESASTVNTRTLYHRDLVLLSRGDRIDERERDICNVRGVKVLMNFRASGIAGGNFNIPTQFNMAVVIVRNNNLIGPTSVNDFDGEKFFRGYKADRTLDFDTTRASIELNENAINSDDYTVLARKSWKIQPINNPENFNCPVYFHHEAYIPIRRQFRFDGTLTTFDALPTDGRVILVYWADKMHVAANTTTTFDFGRLELRCLCYFDEPNMCCPY